MFNLKPYEDRVAHLRDLASDVVDDVMEYVEVHTTKSVERATLRLMGLDGIVGDDEIPRPNVLVDHLGGEVRHGAALFVANGVLRTGKTPDALCDAVYAGELDLKALPLADRARLTSFARELIEPGLERVAAQRGHREERLRPKDPGPIVYVIVATGNIYEDALQAANAARSGADIISVIRSTVQSLLDYVPYGATTEGFGGSYATQENFRIVRRALDEVSDELGRYVRLSNYASGLCMPEIAVMAAMERLDVLVNDCMYGILFRDINMRRTLVDQHFSRMVNALAGMLIHTGEDNILRVSDAVDSWQMVLGSDFLNEQFARRAGLPPEQTGLGHAFEVDPDRENSLLYEITHAMLVSKLFPRSPVKFMPPTRWMTGDIYKAVAINTLYNLVSVMTDQRIHFPGMLSEGIHTPFLHDRHLSLENCDYVFGAARALGGEITFRNDGFIQRRVEDVLESTRGFLTTIREIGLMTAIERGMMADTPRHRDGGRGAEGVFGKAEDYFNPLLQVIEERVPARPFGRVA